MKIKKLLAVLLGMILIFNISAMYVAAADKTSGIKNGEVDKMYAFGLIRNPHVFEADNEVTRGEAAYAFEKMSGYDTAVDKKGTPIIDVDKNVNETEIYKVYSLGIMSCVYGKNFMPDKAVSYGDLVKAAAKVLGYSETIVEKDADFKVYMQALVNGMAIKGAVKAENDSVTWSEFLKFLDDILEADMYEIVPTAEQTEIRKTNKNILNDRLNIYECDGIMTKNDSSSLESEDSLAYGEVQIGDTVLSDCKENTLELLGMNMKAWYHYDDSEDDEKTLLYMCPDSRRNQIIKVNSYDIDSFSIGELQYNAGEKMKRETFPTGIYVLYNGTSVSSYEGWDPECTNGTVTLIDNDNDGDYEVLSIINYDECVVYSKTTDGMVYDLHSSTRNMDLSDDDIRYYKDGETAKYEDIKVYDVVSALKTKDGKITEIIITTNAVSGTITSVSDVSLNGYASSVKVGDTSFYTLESFENIFDGTIRANLEGTFYLDFNGNIVGFTKGADSSLYAYVIKVTFDPYEDEGEAYLKLLTQDGKIGTYSLPEKFTLNGKSYKTKGIVQDYVRESAVIKYKTNTDGKIKWIESAYNNTAESNPTNNKSGYLSLGEKAPEDRLRVTYSKLDETETYINAVGMLGDKARVGNNTIFFKVPKDITETDPNYFAVGKRTMLTDAQKVEFQTYTSSNNAIDSDVCVIFENTKYSASSFLKIVPVGFVEEVNTTINEDDEVRKQVKLRSYTGEATLMEYESGYFNSIKAQKTSISDTFTLKKGDIIRYILNSSGNIIYAELLYRANADGTIKDLNGGQGVVDDFSIRMGYVYKRQDENIALVSQKPGADTTRADWRVFNIEKAKIFVFENNKLRVGTLADVVDYDSCPGDYTQGVLHSMWGQPQAFFIYK